jgi:hypothetical protein
LGNEGNLPGMFVNEVNFHLVFSNGLLTESSCAGTAFWLQAAKNPAVSNISSIFFIIMIYANDAP